jgi:pimeloyl-ACP methyl ester carboxylesterase
MSWVLLRGLTREARHWGDFADQLARALPGSAQETIQVLALDLPGNGVFHKEASPTSVTAMADFARAQLLARGLPPPYRIVAMSLGGMVAADWALRHPDEVDRLVLINTSMRPWAASPNACARATGCRWRWWRRAGAMQPTSSAPFTASPATARRNKTPTSRPGRTSAKTRR